MSAVELDWAEAERLWRSSGALEDRLAMVERALAAIGRRKDQDMNSAMPGQVRAPGRTK